MANLLKITKVNALPATYEASTLYMVPSPDVNFSEIYISDKTGATVRRLPTRNDIVSLINTAIGGYNAALVVANIAERDALALTVTTNVLVLDASADPDVTGGAATYIFDSATATWHKISEAESMDVILQWDNIVGKPNSSAADIDSAVTMKHTHDNLAVLDDVSDVSGHLGYKGEPVRVYLEEEVW